MRNKNGFSLLETLLALALSSGLLTASLVFFGPSLKQFVASKESDDLRLRVTSALSVLSNDTDSARGLYYDPAQCWLSCMTDGIGNRTYYWFGSGANASTLYRKKESVTNAVSCTNGKVIAQNLDPTNTSFSLRRSMLSVKIGAKGKYNNLYLASSLFFPSSAERDIVFYESFECNTLRDGWTVTPGTRSTWGISSTGHTGHYQIGDASSGTGTDSSSIQIPLDLARLTRAHLSLIFSNDNINTLPTSPDSYAVTLWDGTAWKPVFTDASHKNYAGVFQSVEIDLTPYSLNEANILKFTSTLSQTGSHWYVDEIKIFTP